MKSITPNQPVQNNINVPHTLLTISDNDLNRAALKALEWHSAMYENRIRVSVQNGVVTLDGSVEWEFQRTSARVMLGNLKGLRGIVDNLQVISKTDSEIIKKKIIANLYAHLNEEAELLIVEVLGNKAILSGKVRTEENMKNIEKYVRETPGVAEFENKITWE